MRRLIRRWIGDPEVLLEEEPNCPGLFHQYRELLATEHRRVPGGWEWDGKFYPDHLTVGGASFGAFRAAARWCRGEGLDIGAGGWPFPGSKPIDPGWYPGGLTLDEVAADSQDYVFTSHTLEHIKDWRGAIEAFLSKVKPGGVLFIYLPHPECGLWRMENPFMMRHHFWVPEPAVVKEALGSLGLEVLEYDDGPDVMMSFFICVRKPLTWGAAKA
jgi:SAM-dependent methyltransferase